MSDFVLENASFSNEEGAKLYRFKIYGAAEDKQGNKIEVVKNTLAYTMNDLLEKKKYFESEIVKINKKIEAINEMENPKEMKK